MNEAIITLLINAIATPLLVLATMWIKNSGEKDKRVFQRDDKFIKELSDRVSACEKRHEERDKEVREIRVELKNRDGEYLSLYKEHTTLRAQYEVLLADHTDLKKQYELTATELLTLKESIKNKAVEAAKAMNNI